MWKRVTLRNVLRWGVRVAAISFVVLAVATLASLHEFSASFSSLTKEGERFQVLDRNGVPLGITYAGRFNTQGSITLHGVPPLLWHAFVTAEDRDFFRHAGVDWKARVAALAQNIRAAKKQRGASTISEQVVRIMHPRTRNVVALVEGFEAMLLERYHSKGGDTEFYLNQVPYTAQRRGVAQAARYYFNRDVSTLTKKEMLALAVLPRAPSALDIYRDPTRIEPAIARLANAMVARGELTAAQADEIHAEQFVLELPSPPNDAGHFINFIRETVPYRLSDNGMLHTTLDGSLQHKVQQLVQERLRSLERKKVQNAAVLVADHASGEILAWVVASHGKASASAMDAVRAPRQPGSALKPFLYALALDSGWTAATVLHDVPTQESIGNGLHDFRNYSHSFYGAISLREALGNSLNIPAIETIGFVTPKRYLATLHALGFDTLDATADYYKDGLALGSGEVTLYAMVQGFAALANHGVVRPLRAIAQPQAMERGRRVYSEAASLIGNILSDPYARRREFGAGSVLNLQVQTAVKTGTSTDYRDAWVLGYNARYVVGVWMGNLDNTPMDGVTGSVGPALTLRAVFNALGARDTPRALYLSPKLSAQQVCTTLGQEIGSANCFERTEYFMKDTAAPKAVPQMVPPALAIVRPTEGLPHIAHDPRRPAALQAFEFSARKSDPNRLLEWRLNDDVLATTDEDQLLWPLARGKFTLRVTETDRDGARFGQQAVHFVVK